MSGYSDYDTSDYDDSDDEVEDAVYDVWNIDPEFEYDDEWPIFDFDPFSEYPWPYHDSDKIMITYQALSKLSENTSKLLEAWIRRSESVPSTDLHHLDEDCDGMNLYQLELEDRVALRAFSVKKLERLFGGRAEVLKLKQMVDKITVFVKRVMMTILGSSLPCPVPYPAMHIILAYLLPGKGAGNLGQVSIDKNAVELEREWMKQLYLSMAEVFGDVHDIMFYCDLDESVSEPPLVEERRSLEESFSFLVTKVKDSELQVSIEGLEII